MGPTTAGSAFAAANAAMLRGIDGVSTVHVLLADCLTLLGAHSAGVLVRDGTHGHELLATTSHEANHLEMFQALVGDGPCVDAIESGRGVDAAGADALRRRWPDFGDLMSRTGLLTVHAAPMQWHDHVLGGLNLFWAETKHLSADERDLAQSFADICTLALMMVPAEDDSALVAERLRTALRGRVVIERAKGVLAETEGLDMASAFARLVDLSRESSRPLSDMAASVLQEIVNSRTR